MIIMVDHMITMIIMITLAVRWKGKRDCSGTSVEVGKPVVVDRHVTVVPWTGIAAVEMARSRWVKAIFRR